jgi:hypothetical protein
VHNYQRFSRDIKGKQVPYVVAGAGGYANDERSLHKIQKGLENVKLPYKTTHADVLFEKYDESQSGFLTITVSAKQAKFEYYRVPFDGSEPDKDPFDTFSV